MQLDGLSHLILVDAASPVSFFAYPGQGERPGAARGARVHTLAGTGSTTSPRRWPQLAEAVGAGDAEAPVAGRVPTGPADR